MSTNNQHPSTSTYEVEFDITHLLSELLRPNRGTTHANTSANSANTNTNTTTTNATTNSHANADRATLFNMIQRNHNMIDELIYRYNLQMERYNQNMEALIQLVSSTQMRLHQYMYNSTATATATAAPSATNSFTSMRRNAIREDRNIIRTMLNNPLYRSDTSTLLYAYLYPTMQQSAPTTMSAEQRAIAIQNVQYDSATMHDNVCPISLLGFTQGEQVSQIKHCRHVFKPDSLNHWLSSYSTCCPVCRYDIRNYREPTNNREEEEDEYSESSSSVSDVE